MTPTSENIWPWRRLVGIGVAATLVAGGLHFYEQRHLRYTSSLLDDLSTVRSAVYRAVAVAESTTANVSAPVRAVVDLQRVGPQIARLRAAKLPDAERGTLAGFLDDVAQLEAQLVKGGLTDAEVQAALSRPDAVSLRIDESLREALRAQRNDLDASYAFVSLVAVGLFLLAVVTSRRGERRRAEADRELVVREEQYRLMVESLQEGVLIFDADAKVQAGNAAAERVLGATLAELKQIDLDDWHTVDESGALLTREEHPISRALRTGLPVRDVTLCAVRASREPLWLVVSAVPLRQDSLGRVRGAVVTFADVTADRAVRHALAESESTSEALMNALRDGVFVAQAGAFVLANQSLAAMLGYTQKEFDGLRFEDIVDPLQVDAWHALLNAQAAGTTVGDRPHEIRLYGKHGAPAVEFELLCSSVRFRGEHAVLGLMRDISERQVTRAELQLYRIHLEEIVLARTEELEIALSEGRESRVALQNLNDELVIERDRSAAASTAKSAFLANMSHEIRTPMNAIIGLTHLMRREIPGGTLGERLGRVAVAAQHLLKLLDDILDLSKIDAGKLVLDDTEFALDSLMNTACGMVTDAARAKGIELFVTTDHVPLRLRGDPMRLSQALVNLLGNAVKFIEHGSVTLVAKLLERSGDLVTIRLEVVDTGPGIEPDKLASVFGAFEQADSSTTRRYGGTGLGLAITRQLANLMNGSAGADSEVGVGSTFWIEVQLRVARPQGTAGDWTGLTSEPIERGDRSPGAGPDALDLAAETSLRLRHSGARVLLAEDNRVNEEVAVTLLKQAGLQVDVARDGHEAVAMAAARAYALILMDIQMPALDGPAAAEQIRALPGARKTPIVAMTASAYVEDRDRCTAAGMNDFIAKPVDPPRLYATIERWLGPVSRSEEPRVPLDATIVHALNRIEGLDATRGRAFFGGDDAMYRRALNQFCEMYAQGIELQKGIATQRDASHLKRLQRDLHSFAGASSAIGATQWGRDATRLEGVSRADGHVAVWESMDEFNSSLKRFVEGVHACL